MAMPATSAQMVPSYPAAALRVFDLALGDVNHDGKVDIVAGERYPGTADGAGVRTSIVASDHVLDLSARHQF